MPAAASRHIHQRQAFTPAAVHQPRYGPPALPAWVRGATGYVVGFVETSSNMAKDL
ncbi:hypothetical protein ACQP2Y_17270 [Actinoplanes sp. CA-051413]|uniref:hypothetical protein n=1 Tax=Actinoplanes sp. CA-051413 TaxID=3239899 RepID=UPI003D9A0569